MDSIQPSDSESNISGFVCYNTKNYKYLYCSVLGSMEAINQDLLQIEKNLKNIIRQAGPMESQLAALLKSLPKPNKTIAEVIEE